VYNSTVESLCRFTRSQSLSARELAVDRGPRLRGAISLEVARWFKPLRLSFMSSTNASEIQMHRDYATSPTGVRQQMACEKYTSVLEYSGPKWERR